jgi:hypothetical protein
MKTSDHRTSANSPNRHPFSIEMASKKYLSKIEVHDIPRDTVLIEGDLGEVVEIELIEDVMLQISGNKGVFRIDLVEGELRGISNQQQDRELA